MNKIKKEQLEFLDWEFGVFFHFGIRTFYEGHKDWDMQDMPLSAFNPKKLDCENWIKTVRDAGAKYAILVCKHHDGFANWPSEYTEYSVKNTPWKDGKGDVVKEFTDACRKYGIKVGLYYSPADFTTSRHEKKDYDTYFINQICELLGNYGKIDYLWFDGCGSENHEYDTKRIVKKIRELQPEILLFNMWDPDTRWVGNEEGIAPADNHNIVRDLSFSVQTTSKEIMEEERFLPVECDCRIRFRNWFYSENDAHTLKSVDELMSLYHYSVGRGANLLVNIGPDRDGLLPKKDAARLVEFGKEIKKIYENPIADISYAKIDGNRYTIRFDEQKLVRRIIIEEDMSNSERGQHAEEFEINIRPVSYLQPIPFFRGTTIGHKRIIELLPVPAEQITVSVTKESGKTTLKNIQIFE